MPTEFKLVIYEGAKILETVNAHAGTRKSDIIRTLEEFQKSANAALTKLIGDHLDSSKWSTYFLTYFIKFVLCLINYK